MNIDTERLMTLIDLVADEHIEELQIVEAGLEYHLILQAGGVQNPQPRPGLAAAALVDVPSGSPVSQIGAETVKPHVLAAPMSGTFYRAAGTGAKPLVDVGTRVEAGSPICIVEAMKIMNEVAADYPGRIARILVQEGQPVEQGQPLFEIEAGD